MEAPKCKNCDERHWGLCPGDVAKWTKLTQENFPVPASNIMLVSPSRESAEKYLLGKKQRWDRVVYNTYMKNYMRRRRGGD